MKPLCRQLATTAGYYLEVQKDLRVEPAIDQHQRVQLVSSFPSSLIVSLAKSH